MATRIFSKRIVRVALLLLIPLVAIQFIHPRLENPPVSADLQAPPEVKQILERSCYDCHSNQTHLLWFDEIQPAYTLVKGHVLKARKMLNFSHWDSLTPPQQKATLYLSLNKILYGEMPLSQYTMLHRNAKMTEEDITVLKKYLVNLTPVKVSDTSRVNAGNRQYAQWINHSTTPVAVQPAANGIEYIRGYNNWKAISTTDRFDNGTIRVIFGNEVAVKAIEEGNINPWPDGTIFAKVAWDKLVDSSGNIHAGEFKQVEFMIKDAKKYAFSKGWGWARWLGMQLKPYGGKNVNFSRECQGCHQPFKDNDFVFTMPLQLKAK
ncbi:cytochrome P460 [Russula earlei]|uniref:Cytochrome P460 n=1 Tax=Russula earlei TaxID=71964 RepID=A0ACC0TWD2_9AGAM|nr:cytochrome P460 [Russula earlei]